MEVTVGDTLYIQGSRRVSSVMPIKVAGQYGERNTAVDSAICVFNSLYIWFEIFSIFDQLNISTLVYVIRLVNVYWSLSLDLSHHAHARHMLDILIMSINFWLIFRMPRKNRNVAIVVMDRENQLLVIDEPDEVQNFRKITKHFRGIYGI